MQVETVMNLGNRVHAVSTTASLLHPAPRIATFTLTQRAARFGLTALAIVALSALFATQIAATLH